jgi:hypothetical protein
MKFPEWLNRILDKRIKEVIIQNRVKDTNKNGDCNNSFINLSISIIFATVGFYFYFKFSLFMSLILMFISGFFASNAIFSSRKGVRE